MTLLSVVSIARNEKTKLSQNWFQQKYDLGKRNEGREQINSVCT